MTNILDKPLSDEQLAFLLEIMAHGRPYTPEQIWHWIDVDDIEEIRAQRLPITAIMVCLDSIQRRGEPLEASHQMAMPSSEAVQVASSRIAW